MRHRLDLSSACCRVFALLIAALSPAPSAKADEPPAKTPSGAAFLEKAWPSHPEWLAMLADIFVKGDSIGGGDGWFRHAVAQSRFGWDASAKRFDRDADGKISRKEFPGADADFARLDRDADGSLSPQDFDFATPPPGGPSPGAILFSRADRDGNGKLTRDEFTAFFKASDKTDVGFLSLDDLKEAFASAVGPRGSSGAPDRATFLKSFVREELGSFTPGPDLNEHAPDFALKTVNGGGEVRLSALVGPKPVVLIFGNFTCGPFRRDSGNLEKLYERYKGRASFLLVYVREAHPTDGWRMENNDRLGVSLRQPRTFNERVEVARTCEKTLGFRIPMVLDSIDDEVNHLYSGIPSRFYVIDRQGKIAYKSGRGPFGFRPAEMEQSLLLLLQEEEGSNAARQARAPTP